jgi:hypothetical protein
MSWQNEDNTPNKKIFILHVVATVTEFEKHYGPPPLSLSPPTPFDILHPTVIGIKLNELV